MRAAEAELLFIPGLGNSGPDHWQTRWREKLSTARTIEQDDWLRPQRDAWIARICDAINAAEKPVVLLAHSLGVIAAAHASQQLPPGKVRGAFLVCPPAAAVLHDLPDIDPAFAPYPQAPLPFPALLVASRNDAYASFAQSEDLALDWGAQIVDAGEAGHINADSGHGPWPEGLMRFAAFLGKL